MVTGTAPRWAPVHHWCHSSTSSAGRGVPSRPGGRRGEPTCMSAAVQGLGSTTPTHLSLLAMRTPGCGLSWLRVTSRRARAPSGVRGLTQVHTLGPVVVGGGTTLSGEMEPSPEGSGKMELVPSGSDETAPVPSGSGDTGPVPEGSGEAETVPSGSVETEIRPRLSRRVCCLRSSDPFFGYP